MEEILAFSCITTIALSIIAIEKILPLSPWNLAPFLINIWLPDKFYRKFIILSLILSSYMVLLDYDSSNNYHFLRRFSMVIFSFFSMSLKSIILYPFRVILKMNK